MLSINRLEKRYGGVAALADCTFEIPANRITAIIGPNGAGKSTLLNCIAGAEKADSGAITFDGETVTDLPPHALARRGIARTFQISRELASLTLLENVLLANRADADAGIFDPLFRPARVRDAENAAIRRATALLDRVGLSRLTNETANVLSGGQKKLLELARALMLEPRIVLLDEPAAGVAPPMVSVLADIIRGLNAEGVTFALVEHNMDMVAALSDQVVVMAEGSPLVIGSFAEVTADPRVVEAYLGGVL